MTTKHDGGPAFPCQDIIRRNEKGNLHGYEISSDGMSIRDYFAAQAMGVLMAHMVSPNAEDVAVWAYKHADAMLAERSKP